MGHVQHHSFAKLGFGDEKAKAGRSGCCGRCSGAGHRRGPQSRPVVTMDSATPVAMAMVDVVRPA